ncbi:MAG: transcription-repair coupling factor [Buchnera aphidicola (Microlophium carnosum)]|uniref:Transcription-repair-coupling factor n=1 Tax=Buchnera aphidicola (Microlophium carnosum) TaxID=2708354 RepID=A0A6G9JT24_9GAMM|nr:MAG: transcription-repair coupling factor [Buchnera aphidicola (Microlophium carnosum)]
MKITEKKKIDNKNIIDFNDQKLSNLFHNINTQKKINNVLSYLYDFSGKIIFSLTKEKSLTKILKFLEKNNIYPQYIKKIIDINKKFDYFYMIKELQNGFLDKKNNFLFICTKDLLPVLIDNKYIANIKKNTNTLKKNNLSQLVLNYPIIHIEHGIGRYEGLTTIETASIQSEYLIISYAEGDKLYVPISYLHLVSPYTGTSIENAPLHKLGGDDWNKEKNKISKTIYDHAAQLLQIYAKRASKKGFAFKKDQEKYECFCNHCSFKTTSDQNKVMKFVLRDMSNSIPMDRLICGDVGFGKTEIAMRASFLAVSNNKQVAILVPTTLLAQQHYKNFKIRFSNYSIIINILSRFQMKKEQDLIFKNIKNGKINILIGTHKLLFKKIEWHSLGLLIIDEEHKFGVSHKEIIKKVYSNIDVLTLTATPIPRTLNMAMTGIKDVSIISNPPAQRLAIKTFIQEYNPLLIRKTILREISRGGQIYYIYNKVKNIMNIAERLTKLIPEANIKIGHGQMKNIDLKKVMNEFYKNKFNVLICTTIIESGVDIPRANTIIIENSNHFGLSQLHQLRGRIGRSNHQGYALFLVNNFNKITPDAKKRLEAISSVDNFGGGFSLSNQDLEIRGVGEILGKEQSGHVKSIGFSLYMELLNNAIDLLKTDKVLSVNQLPKKSLEIELHVSSLLPDNYIVDVNTRLFFYKKISDAKNEEEIENIKYELIDQFGKLPDFSKNLILIAKIRLMAYKIGIKYIKSNKKTGVIEFNHNNTVNIKYLLKIFQEEPKIWKMENPTKIKFLLNVNKDYLRLKWIINLLRNLHQNSF